MYVRSVIDAEADEVELLIPVTGEEGDEEEIDDSTLEEGVSAPDEEGATEVASTDENQDKQPDVEKQYEELKAKYEKDVGAVKSALDKKMAEATKKWEAERKETEKLIQELRKSTMNDDQRKEYEQQLAQKQVTDYEAQLQELQAAQKERETRDLWLEKFISYGIPLSKLNMSGTFAEFFASGMEARDAQVAELEEQVKNAAKTQPKPKGKTPASVAKPGEAEPPTGLSVKELADKYANGSVEVFYHLASRNPKILDLLNESLKQRSKNS